MKSILTLILILTIATFPALAGVPIASWVKEPIVRFVATSYLMQPDSMSEFQKSAAVIDHLESAILGVRKIPIQSLEDYLAHRDQMPSTMQEYQKSIQHEGLINPFNITTPNSEVFEKIVEFEVRNIQRLLDSWPGQLKPTYDMIVVRQTMQSMLSVYLMGLGLRDGIEGATQSWEGVFGLGLLRSIGKNIVNPMVRSVIYSDSVLNRLRNEFRSQLRKARSALSHNFDGLNRDFQSHGKAMIEDILESDMAGLEVMKPFRNLDPSVLFDLVQSFIKTMPLDVKQELAWAFLKSPTDQPMALVVKYPRQLDLINHFLNWIQTDPVKHKIKALHPLPLWEMARSMALVLKENFNHSEAFSSARVLGEFNQRSRFGIKKASIKITIEPLIDGPDAQGSYSLTEYESKFPDQAEFVKKQVADVVIHNAFGFGLRSNLSDTVKIKTENDSKNITVQLFSVGVIVDHPIDRPDRFIDDLSRMVSRQLFLSVANMDEIKASEWDQVYEKQSPENREKINQFISEPENLLWSLQLYQLKKLVGENMLRDQMKLFFLKHPNLVMSFIYKKWKQRSDPTPAQRNQCLRFYKY